ncbi:MAG: hypothetical protein JW967_04090 [Dehalococcoidales bacterium]|nr:hypothetical protein [Dehalococcoidales bacterium]
MARPLPNTETQALTSLVTRQNQVMGMLITEKNRLHTPRQLIYQRIQLYIDWLEKELDVIDQITHCAICRCLNLQE